MGLFDFFRSKKAVPTSESLREMLFAAIQANDWPSLAELCEKHHPEIVRAFSGWKAAPPTVRGDPAALQRFGQCMGTLADFFARVRGEPELLQQLIGPEDSNPIYQWNQKLQQALKLMEEVRYPAVIPLMKDLLAELQHFQGDAVGDYLAKAHGHLGCSYFQTGCPAQALEPLRQALNLCRQRGDAEGQLIHLTNIFELHRYLGQAGPAADHADERAELLAKQGKHEDATWCRRQAAIVRGGEPLVRVIAAAKGLRYELDDPAILSRGGYFDFIFHRNRISLQPALHLTDQGLQFGNQGQYQEAFSALLAATKADRFDPQPWYHMGACLLYAGLYNEAAMSYRKAEELAPGWFHCRRYFWLAQQLGEGRLDQDTFLTLQALDGAREDRTPEAKVTLAREGLAKTPDVAWLYLCLGGYLKELGQPQEAEAAFRCGVDHAENADDVDVQSCLMLELALVLPENSRERTRLLEAVRELKGNLIATASAGLVLNTPGSR
jgi:tetratricopeptide (TPR) repeat protein